MPTPELEANNASEFGVYGNRVQRLERGARITSRVKYQIPAHRHTVAHQGLEITSGEQKLGYVVDATYNQIISLRCPNWSFQLDVNQEATAHTRRRLLEMAASETRWCTAITFRFQGRGACENTARLLRSRRHSET